MTGQRRSAIVLAGGRSRRMGADKRELDLDGRRLLDRAAAAAAEVADEVIVVQRPDSRVALPPGAVEALDARAADGPLVGLEAGLDAAAHDLCLVLAGDHPGLAAGLLGQLAGALAAEPEADAVVCTDGTRRQPLLGAYRRRVRGTAAALLDEGARGPMALLDALRVVELAPSRWAAADPAADSLVDLDTPLDVAGWRARER